ncbi:MAG TPA: uroporphyrinogen decarboxylase family protein [Methanomassiliicoccaceae archaeon]|jgi:uroporphyrinogen decarboxylase|nr:uroporphyrinogen decarboxylase family protein [Methanomassiliicoccaceae archaeon]HOK27894.1 uroporphyrinogen decarboxylase family protein [Methanomassiliicoccaceae archaeon]HOL07375.1 uroporphyrinogen decarboxylase family protein [Methanomassiliicoccaceae archaeon]HOQ26556.1 uroporphyrinogen decarboxylase family protein [Methanomassiliicoccaceae archaeon]
MVSSSKELVRALFEGEGVERVPVFPPFSGFLATALHGITNQEAIDNPALAAHAQIEMGQLCGFDGMEMIADFLCPAEACGSKAQVPDYGLMPTISPVIEELSDIDRLGVPDPREDHRFVSSLAAAEEIDKRIGRTHYLYATMSGPFTLLGELRGLERFFFDLIIEPGAVREMMRYANEVLNSYHEEIDLLDPDAIVVADPTTSGSFLSADLFRKFVLSSNVALAHRIGSRGRDVMWHICGDSFDIFREMSLVEADMLSVDAPVSLSAVSDLFPDTIIIGNLPPEGALTGGPPIEVVKQSVRCMNEMIDRKYILAAGCGLTLDCEVEYIRMMRYSSEQFSLIRR